MDLHYLLPDGPRDWDDWVRLSGIDCLISGFDCLISGFDCLIYGFDCLIQVHHLASTVLCVPYSLYAEMDLHYLLPDGPHDWDDWVRVHFVIQKSMSLKYDDWVSVLRTSFVFRSPFGYKDRLSGTNTFKDR